MADPVAIIKQTFDAELAGFISSALGPYIASEGGVQSDSSSGVRWTIEETEANTYTYQSDRKEQVAEYRRKSGVYVAAHERQVAPIKVPINENLAGLDSALDRGITMLIQKVQSKV